ncbi:lipid-A-disaccharide synthase N-terminal domain-containing protein [Limisalsivibrio acetivorans]|uniref:lipid-A-disaccharide synthase N-terminal domain-containing protein n=1 Tax=Limisalsivibrio acetivorans TaxID=1304888 RepID=UPI0003B621F0|nr:lipid-A-disaccharide synthase N-terminal domain-containing protein [Limisalsivibrio acetivorans]
MTSFETFLLIFGIAGQIIFFTRFIIQWLYTERQKRSVVPISFWYFSLSGSFILLTYSIIIKDPIFIFGQSLGFIIYLRNLYFIYLERGVSKSKFTRYTLIFLIVYVGVSAAAAFIAPSIREEKEASQLLWIYGIGLVGQGFFFLRFFVQWLYSEKLRKSAFPVLFWYFSIAGSVFLLTYSIIVGDVVFIIGQIIGLLIYFRNIYYIGKEAKASE